MYDAAIIGAGPAGLSAALNLKLHNKNIIWFGNPALSDKVQKSEKIANYPGFGMVGGQTLNEAFRKQIQEQGLELTDRMVTSIMASRQGFMLLADNEIFEAKTVLFATGSVSAKGLPNEQALLGHGVSYCATCDGFLYAGKSIAVYCAAKRYEHEVEYLAGIAEQVHLYCTYQDCGIELPNVIRLQSPIKAVCGEDRVSGILLADGTEIPVDGAFFLRNAVAPATLLKNLELEGPHIRVNRQAETNVPGCFAAGDCTGRPYQIAKAVGEGNVAAHSIVAYLSELDKK
ncbi:MAG: NAD(P)/FAD-dependent oxidoreductase [Firmicutes bacterium]|nr:NAD(P)/FAD-dependent oxidoreductase [Bacillota bacterium]